MQIDRDEQRIILMALEMTEGRLPPEEESLVVALLVKIEYTYNRASPAALGY